MSTRTKEVTKVALYSLLILGLGVLATACSNRNTTSNGTSSGVQIRIWRTGQSEDVLKSPISSFVSKNSSANLIVTYNERSIDTYELDALKSLGARTGPDVWSIPIDWLGDHIPRIQNLPPNYFFPVDDEGKRATSGPTPAQAVKEFYPEGIAEQIIADDGENVLGLPMNVDSLRLYYNPELFEAAVNDFRTSKGENIKSEELTPVEQLLSAPPESWAKLVEMEKYITKLDGNNVLRSTIALGSADNISQSSNILSLLMLQNGGEIVGVDRKRALFHIPTTTAGGKDLSPGSVALDFFTSFSNPAKTAYTWNASMPQDIDAFGQGRVAMVIAFSDFGKQLRIKYPRFSFEEAPVPQNSIVNDPVNLITFSLETVTKTADNSAAAFAFLPYYTGVENARDVAGESGLFSPFKTDLTPQSDNAFAKQVLTGKSIYKRSRTQFDATFRQMIVNVSQNGMTADKAVDAGADRINTLLRADDQL